MTNTEGHTHTAAYEEDPTPQDGFCSGPAPLGRSDVPADRAGA